MRIVGKVSRYIDASMNRANPNVMYLPAFILFIFSFLLSFLCHMDICDLIVGKVTWLIFIICVFRTPLLGLSSRPWAWCRRGRPAVPCRCRPPRVHTAASWRPTRPPDSTRWHRLRWRRWNRRLRLLKGPASCHSCSESTLSITTDSHCWCIDHSRTNSRCISYNSCHFFRNIVCTVNLVCRLDLKKIALHARNAEYNPKRFAAVIMRIRDPRTTALIFSSGKMVCTGAKRWWWTVIK